MLNVFSKSPDCGILSNVGGPSEYRSRPRDHRGALTLRRAVEAAAFLVRRGVFCRLPRSAVRVFSVSTTACTIRLVKSRMLREILVTASCVFRSA